MEKDDEPVLDRAAFVVRKPDLVSRVVRSQHEVQENVLMVIAAIRAREGAEARCETCGRSG